MAVAALDPFGERVHVGLQAFERAARHRLVQRMRDVGEVGAQRRDRVLDAARLAQRLDLRRDVGQLAFEIGEVGAGRGRRGRRIGGLEHRSGAAAPRRA